MNKKIFFLVFSLMFLIAFTAAENATYFEETLTDEERLETFESYDDDQKSDLLKSYADWINEAESDEERKNNIENFATTFEEIYEIDILNLDELSKNLDEENKLELDMKNDVLMIKKGDSEHEIDLNNVPEEITEINYIEDPKNIEGSTIQYKTKEGAQAFLSHGTIKENAMGNIEVEENGEIVGEVTFNGKEGFFLRGTPSPVTVNGKTTTFEDGNYVWGKTPNDAVFKTENIIVRPSNRDNPVPNNPQIRAGFYIGKENGFTARGAVSVFDENNQELTVDAIHQNDLNFHINQEIPSNAKNAISIFGSQKDGFAVRSKGEIRNTIIAGKQGTEIVYEDANGKTVALTEGPLQLAWDAKNNRQNIFADRKFQGSVSIDGKPANVNPQRQQANDATGASSGGSSGISPEVTKSLEDATVKVKGNVPTKGLGSGTIIGSLNGDTYVLTAGHVISSDTGSQVPGKVTVTDKNGKIYSADVVGFDLVYRGDRDLAILRIPNVDNLPSIPVYGGELQVGQQISRAGFTLGQNFNIINGVVLPSNPLRQQDVVSGTATVGESGGPITIAGNDGRAKVVGAQSTRIDSQEGKPSAFTRLSILQDLLRRRGLSRLIVNQVITVI